ncbi:MAG TPA: Smr/MutS family protein, partial [Sphingomicrobium sp.]
SLSPEEAELWERVAVTIRPLSREKVEAKPVDQAKRVLPTPTAPPVTTKPPPTPLRRPVPIGEKTLDGSWDKKLRSGSVEPDRVLDLHGMSLDTAWAAIDRGLEQAIARGDRVVLLITGHHRRGEPPIQRGRIRAAVHDWLAASRHAGDIAAVRGAHGRHGGGGSLYLILRRQPRHL